MNLFVLNLFLFYPNRIPASVSSICLLTTFTKQSVALLMVCQKSKSLFCTSRNSNEYAALRLRPISISKDVSSVRYLDIED